MWKVIKYMLPYAGAVLLAIALLFVQAMCDLALPDFMSDIVNDGVVAGDTGLIFQKGLQMLGMTLLGSICAVIVGLIASRVAAGVSQKLRSELFSKVESFSNAEFDKFSTASLITRTTNDITQVQMIVVMLVRMVFYAPIMGVGGVVRALSKSVSMSWIIALAVLVLIGIILILFSVAMPKFQKIQGYIDRLNLVMRENLEGMLVIRAFNTQRFEEKRFDKANKTLTSTNLFVNRSIATMMPAMMLVMNLLTILIVWVGSKQVSNLKMDVGDMMAYMQYAMQIMQAFLMMSMMFIMLPRAAVSANRINEVLETEASIVDKETPVTYSDIFDATVEFRDVSFRYPGGQGNVLEHISFIAKPGETTAFIGATGSGKTTLVSLIPRFYDVTQGQILIDGTDIRDVPMHELRERIGYVPQKSILFSGTVESNLYYADKNSTQENIERAADIAQATEFITSKPTGYKTPIAQGGTNVSGGQKQRLSIARALVKNAPINIFDDSFSALDLKTDAALRARLKQETGDSTVLLVAQRVSTIMNAEQIIVLDNGQIVGRGTHETLLETCPIYQEIASSQMSREEMSS
jgi:ATP-binding cassette subfamily B multidrug efflux pump